MVNGLQKVKQLFFVVEKKEKRERFNYKVDYSPASTVEIMGKSWTGFNWHILSTFLTMKSLEKPAKYIYNTLCKIVFSINVLYLTWIEITEKSFINWLPRKKLTKYNFQILPIASVICISW